MRPNKASSLANDTPSIPEDYYEKDAVRVLGLMVRSDRQRLGVGRALISHLAAIARGSGKQKLLARTIKETGNVLVFQRLGFVVIDEHQDTLFVSDLFPCLTEVELEKVVNTLQERKSISSWTYTR